MQSSESAPSVGSIHSPADRPGVPPYVVKFGTLDTSAVAAFVETVTGDGGGCGSTVIGGPSPPPSRHDLGSANTTLQPEHWYSSVARSAPCSSRAMTRR